MIDPFTQGVCLITKWIIRVLDGATPWKSPIRHIIATTKANNTWKEVGWKNKILMAK